MIPMVLLNIVDKYNEVGMFIVNENNTLDWFNGKRWENFKKNCGNVIRYKNKIFIENEYQWYKLNGQKTNISQVILSRIGFHCKRLIQIKIKNIMHTYIFTKRNIEHFNGNEWTNNKKATIKKWHTCNDFGNCYYLLTYCYCEKWNFIKKSQNIVGIIYCEFQQQHYVIDLHGDLFLTELTCDWTEIDQSHHKIASKKTTGWF